MFSRCVSTDQGFCFRKPWRERFFRCFRRFSAQPGCLWSFSRRSPKVTAGNLEVAPPGLAATGSPPWAAPAALISRCGEVGLEGRFSLWAGTGWWAHRDLVVRSPSHLRTGWQWGKRIPEVLFSVPVWIQGPQAVGCLLPRWRSVQRVVGMCLEGRGLGVQEAPETAGRWPETFCLAGGHCVHRAPPETADRRRSTEPPAPSPRTRNGRPRAATEPRAGRG